MKKLILFGLTCIASCALAYLQPTKGDKTTDVHAYVSTHSEFPKNGLQEFTCSNCRALNNAVFVAPISTCGTGSCDYMLFERKGQEAKYITTISIAAGAFEFLKSSHNGYPDIKIYQHLSADEGMISTLQFDGNEYKTTGKQKKIASNKLQTELQPEKVTAKSINP
ncbi:MAG: hypothetical protein AABZ31_05335 [Bdellovibrionota bacterium]